MTCGSGAAARCLLLRAPVDLLLDPVGEPVDELRLELRGHLVPGRQRGLELVPELLLLGHFPGSILQPADLL